MPNDSSTGGYLAPISTNDLNDQALADFLQGIVVGVVGLPGAMVRPRWQPQPPPMPDPSVDWCAIGPGSRKRDDFSATIHQPAGQGSDLVIRQRELEILCSFYGPNAEGNAELLAMGLEVPQNREELRAEGFQLIGGAGNSLWMPVQVKQLWYTRVDIGFRVSQQQQYTYPVLNLLGAAGTVVTDEMPAAEAFTVSPPA